MTVIFILSPTVSISIGSTTLSNVSTNDSITVGIKGDFNNNGRVDIGDIAKVAFYLAGKVDEL